MDPTQVPCPTHRGGPKNRRVPTGRDVTISTGEFMPSSLSCHGLPSKTSTVNLFCIAQAMITEFKVMVVQRSSWIFPQTYRTFMARQRRSPPHTQKIVCCLLSDEKKWKKTHPSYPSTPARLSYTPSGMSTRSPPVSCISGESRLRTEVVHPSVTRSSTKSYANTHMSGKLPSI